MWRTIGHPEAPFRPLRIGNEEGGGVLRAVYGRARCVPWYSLASAGHMLSAVSNRRACRPKASANPACTMSGHWCGSRASFANSVGVAQVRTTIAPEILGGEWVVH